MENSPPYENPLVIGHPALREVSTPVADGSELPDNLIRTMNWIAMEDKRKKMNLVPALSAPQLGINKRIIGTGFTTVDSLAYAGYNFRPRKVFEGVHLHVLVQSLTSNLDQKCILERT